MATTDHKLLVSETLALLQNQLAQPHPCVAQASMILGSLQDRLFSSSHEPLQGVCSQYMYRFQELFVEPATTKLAKCKTPQDKVVALGKFLRGKLAKAPAHKQPLHTQYLPSALRDSGKRQLDCLGIATAVLALCHHIAAAQPQQHGQLAAASMVVSDDHCWLALPAQEQGFVAGAPTDNNTSSDQQPPQQQQQQQQLVYIEVTDPGVMSPAHMSGSWLYAGGHGTPCSAAQVLMVLVAGLMPEELQDESSAAQLREVQLQLLGTLAGSHPESLFYSNCFRWGMLHEEAELQQLAEAAEAAAASGDMSGLTALALLPPAQLPSQQQYAASVQRSSGWQWHPSSCAAFGWLNRMQAALCGETDDLLCFTPPASSQQQQHQHQHEQQLASSRTAAKLWLDIAAFMLQQALQAVAGCTAVLRRYSGCAGKPNKAADTQLMEAVRDLWQNLVDASKAVACLTQLHAYQQQQQQQPGPQETAKPGSSKQPPPLLTDALSSLPAALQQGMPADQPQQQQQLGKRANIGGHLGADVPAAAAVPSHTVHLAAAVDRATAGSSQHSTAQITLQGALTNSSWLRPQLEFLDALLCFFGEESADVPADAVADFVAVAQTFSSAARQQALADALAQQAVHSSRVQGLAGSALWVDMAPGLQQQLQMPGARSRKKQRKE